MEHEKAEQIACDWERMAYTARFYKKVPLERMRILFKDTYEILTRFHKDAFMPKALAKILMNMDLFLYLVSMSEGPQEGCAVGIVFEHYAVIYDMISALKTGFFAGKYESEFPVLCVADCHKDTYLFDLENGRLEDLV